MSMKRCLAACMLAAILLLVARTGSAHAGDVWGKRDPNYAVLPGVSIGAIALSMSEELARKAALRYGAETRQGDAYEYGGKILFEVFEGKVVRIAAAWDSQWYLVVADDEDNFPHAVSANAVHLIQYFGDPDEDTLTEYTANWDAYGLQILYEPTMLMVLGFAVYAP